MRRAAMIAAVLLLAVSFTAAWFAFGPDEAEQQSPQFTEGSVADKHAGGPLEGENRELAVLARDGSEPGKPEERAPDAEVSRSGDTTAKTPDETAAGATPTTRDGTPGRLPAAPSDGTTAGEAPAPGAGEAPALPFIKRHDRPPGQNLGNTRPGARRISKPTGVKKLEEVSAKLMQDRRGLYAEYFRLTDSDITKLDTSSPDMVRIDRQVYFPDAEAFSDLPFPLENFAAVWEGFLVIPEQGDYWLFWGADNGGRVELDGETVLLQDGMVRYVEVSAVLTLQPGLHPLRIEFAQTHNAVADWAKCAANFMWVPQGQTKPVPVPPEVLMVPEWMWSDNAPIITSLSKYEGEIGDEIAIEGQNLEEAEEDTEYGYETSVFLAGQKAKVLEGSASRLRVTVPIGAKTGEVIVFKRARNNPVSLPNVGKLMQALMHPNIPSNSVTFTVTTQFGLMAEWHNLEGWSNFGFEVFEATEPGLTRLEADAGRVNAPPGYEVGAVRWEGRIGVPEELPAAGTPTDQLAHILVLWTAAPGRARVGAQTVELLFMEELGGQRRHCALFTLEETPPCMLELSIELLLQQPIEVPRWRFEYRTQDGEVNGSGLEHGNRHILWEHQFYPPVTPPKPPVISSVHVMLGEGEQAVAPPYELDPSRPLVSVGQEFIVDVLLTIEGNQSWGSLPEGETNWVELFVDGVAVPYTNREWYDRMHGNEAQKFWCTMPSGVGEGKLAAKLGMATSESFLIDIANRGLVAYLYDVPDASGLAKLPDLGPCECFKVRKDRAINFESAASFDLPFPAETFVIEWLGGLIIEEEGDYTFTCRSDDGMKLWLDDNVVLDADRLQAPAENSATVHLVPGTYRFRMQFFENNQHEVCVLEWAATRGSGEALQTVIPRAVIPARAFTLDVHPPFPNKTSTGKRTDGS